MSNVDKIIEKIQSDAQQEAADILQEAQAKADQILTEAEAQAYREAEIVIEQGKQQARFDQERRVANLQLAARDQVLEARQKTLDRIFDLAKEKLANLSKADMQQLLEAYFAHHPAGDDTCLWVGESYRDCAPSGVQTLVDETIQSGFKVQRQGIIENHDFAELVQYLKDDLMMHIVEQLQQVVYEA